MGPELVVLERAVPNFSVPKFLIVELMAPELMEPQLVVTKYTFSNALDHSAKM